MKKSTLGKMAWATLGIAAVGATALPLVSIWQQQDAAAKSFPVVSAIGRADDARPTTIVVDLRDNVSSGAIAEIERNIGVDLEFASPYAEDDKMMVATLPSVSAAQTALSRLAGDGRVEVAEEEQVLTIPEMSAQDSIEMQAIAVAEATRKAAVDAKSAARDAARAAGIPVQDYIPESSFDNKPECAKFSGDVTESERFGSDVWRNAASGDYTLHVENRSFAVDNTGAGCSSRWLTTAQSLSTRRSTSPEPAPARTTRCTTSSGTSRWSARKKPGKKPRARA
jgi:hypothetical protein